MSVTVYGCGWYHLLKQLLTRAHIKPRWQGHRGTTPGLNFVYVHLGRVNNLLEHHI